MLIRSEEITCKVLVYCTLEQTNNPVRPVQANIYCRIAKSVRNGETSGLEKGEIWWLSHDT